MLDSLLQQLLLPRFNRRRRRKRRLRRGGCSFYGSRFRQRLMEALEGALAPLLAGHLPEQLHLLVAGVLRLEAVIQYLFTWYIRSRGVCLTAV